MIRAVTLTTHVLVHHNVTKRRAGGVRERFWFTSSFFLCHHSSWPTSGAFLTCSSHQKCTKTLTNLWEMRNSGFLFKAHVAITQSALLG